MSNKHVMDCDDSYILYIIFLKSLLNFRYPHNYFSLKNYDIRRHFPDSITGQYDITVTSQSSQSQRWPKRGIFISSCYGSQVSAILWVHRDRFLSHLHVIIKWDISLFQRDMNMIHFPCHAMTMWIVKVAFGSRWFHILVKFWSRCY